MPVKDTFSLSDPLAAEVRDRVREEDVTLQQFIETSVEAQLRKPQSDDPLASPHMNTSRRLSGPLNYEFIVGLSHLVRTAITSILGFTEILEDEVALTQQELVAIIQRGGKRLLQAIDTVEYIARLDAGVVELAEERINAGDRLRALVAYFRERAEAKGVQLQVEPPSQCIYLNIDPDMFTRIATALVDNAVKFTDKGHVTVRIRKENDALVLGVTDTGRGIPTEEGKKIFDPFYQRDVGNRQDVTGSGLGLTVTKTLVKFIDGDITWKSSPGEGTTFAVTLPGCVVDAVSQKRSGKETHAWGFDQLPPRQSVLLVEDDPAICQLIPVMLPDSYTIDVLKNPTTALEQATINGYDIVLMDINLGDSIDGIELMQRMREIEGYQDTLFIAVTAYGERHEGETFHERGFDGYVSKPFSKKTLYENLIQIRNS